MLSVLQLPAIDEECHVPAQTPLIVEHVIAGARVSGKVCVESLAKRRPIHLPDRTLDVSLNVVGESDGWHLQPI